MSTDNIIESYTTLKQKLIPFTDAIKEDCKKPPNYAKVDTRASNLIKLPVKRNKLTTYKVQKNRQILINKHRSSVQNVTRSRSIGETSHPSARGIDKGDFTFQKPQEQIERSPHNPLRKYSRPK